MTGAIWVVSLLAATVGSALAAAVGGPSRPWFVASVAAIVALEVGVVRGVHTSGGGDYLRWRRVELLGGVVLIRLIQALTGGAGGVVSPAIADRETIAAVVMLVIARSAMNATIDDEDALAGGVARTDGTDPVTRLRARIIGYALLTTLLDGYASIGTRGLFDLARSGVGDMRWEPIVYLAIGLPALAFASLRGHQARWRRDGAVVDASVRYRWVRHGAAISAVAVLVVVAAWFLSIGGSAVAAIGITRAGPVGEWIVDRIDQLGEIERTETDRGPADVVDPVAEFDIDPDRVPGWLGEAMFWAIAIGVIAWAGMKGRQMSQRPREARVRSQGPGVRAVIREVLELLRSLWRTLVSLLKRASRVASSRLRPSPVPTVGAEPVWQSDDEIRVRIVTAYRRAARHIGAMTGRRRRSETPREFSQRASGAVPHAARDLDAVTSSYEEARFSLHLLTAEDAGRAEHAADRVQNRDRPRDG